VDTHKLALIGFGGVARGFCQVLARTQSSFEVVAINTRSWGTISCGPGTPLHDPAWQPDPVLFNNQSAAEMILETEAETIVELTPTDIHSAQPATDYCRLSLESGKNLVTANKGPLALAGPELHHLAETHGCYLGYESCIMSGTPTVHLTQLLADQPIHSMTGILNGTSNYILCQMEQGLSFQQALRSAQKLGYAEPDPSADVEGYDVMAKVLILANNMMGLNLTPDDIPRRGITQIGLDSIEAALDHGERWKLLAIIDHQGARVEPRMLPSDSILAGFSGPTNALSIQTEFLGEVVLSGPGAGPIATGYGIYHDLCRIVG